MRRPSLLCLAGELGLSSFDLQQTSAEHGKVAQGLADNTLQLENVATCLMPQFVCQCPYHTACERVM